MKVCALESVMHRDIAVTSVLGLIPCLSVLFYIAKEYIYFSVCTGERWHDDAVRCVLSL